MIRILLVCSAGMSTSALVNKMNISAAEQQLEAKIWAVGDALAEQEAKNADVVLVGPQMKFQLDRIRSIVDASIPVSLIDMRDYGMMNGKKVLQTAIELVNNK